MLWKNLIRHKIMSHDKEISMLLSIKDWWKIRQKIKVDTQINQQLSRGRKRNPEVEIFDSYFFFKRLLKEKSAEIWKLNLTQNQHISGDWKSNVNCNGRETTEFEWVKQLFIFQTIHNDSPSPRGEEKVTKQAEDYQQSRLVINCKTDAAINHSQSVTFFPQGMLSKWTDWSKRMINDLNLYFISTKRPTTIIKWMNEC